MSRENVRSKRSMRRVSFSGRRRSRFNRSRKTLQRTTRTGLRRFSGERSIDVLWVAELSFSIERLLSSVLPRRWEPNARRCLKAGGDNARGSLVLEGKTVITSHFLSASTSYSALSAATITAISTMHFHISFFFSFFSLYRSEVLGASHAPRNKKLLTMCTLHVYTSLLSDVVFGVNHSRHKSALIGKKK